MAEERIRTSDMTLVTFLRVSGYTPAETVWEDRTCYWYFLADPKVVRLRELYDQQSAQVEPVEFSRVFAITRREFFDTKPIGQHA